MCVVIIWPLDGYYRYNNNALNQGPYAFSSASFA